MLEVIIKGGFLSAALIYSSFILGHFIIKWLKKDTHIYRAIVYGFAGIIALFEVIAVIFIELKTRYMPLYYTFACIIAIALLVATVVFIKNKEYVNYKDSFRLKQYLNPILIVAILVIGFQMFNSAYLTHTDADDGYFITISNIALEQDKITYDGDEVYDGKVATGETVRSDTFSWELFVAFLSRTSGMHPAVICHSVFPVLLLLLSYMVFYDVGVGLLEDTDKQRRFLLILAVLNLFGGYTVYSSGCFVLLRLWQGKAMLPGFFFPLLISNCIDIFKKKENIGTWIYNAVIVAGGMAMSTVALYLMPILYICIGIPLVVTNLAHKEFKETGRIIARAVITVLPIIIYDLFVIIRLLRTNIIATYSQSAAPSYRLIFERNMLQGFYIILLCSSLVYILIRKKSEAGCKILVGITITVMLTFLNPLAIGIVAKKITGVDVYWRLYWIIPIYILIAYAASIIEINKKYIRYSFIVAIAIIIGIAGEYMYSDKYFSAHSNKYKIPTEIITVCNLLSGNPDTTCLFPADISYYPRQYTSGISVVCARDMQISKREVSDLPVTYQEVYECIYGSRVLSDELLIKALKNLSIDYIYTREQRTDVFYKLVKQIEPNGYLYQVAY